MVTKDLSENVAAPANCVLGDFISSVVVHGLTMYRRTARRKAYQSILFLYLDDISCTIERRADTLGMNHMAQLHPAVQQPAAIHPELGSGSHHASLAINLSLKL